MIDKADPDPLSQVSPLTGTTWVLSAMRTGEVAHGIPGGVRATLTLEPGEDEENAQAHVEAGCNSGAAQVRLGADSLEFGPLALTRKICDADAMTIEAAVCAVLAGEVPYSWEGHVLTLGNIERSLVYRSDLSLG